MAFQNKQLGHHDDELSYQTISSYDEYETDQAEAFLAIINSFTLEPTNPSSELNTLGERTNPFSLEIPHTHAQNNYFCLPATAESQPPSAVTRTAVSQPSFAAQGFTENNQSYYTSNLPIESLGNWSEGDAVQPASKFDH